MSLRMRNATLRLASPSIALSILSTRMCSLCRNQYSDIGTKLKPLTVTSPIRSSWSRGWIRTTSGSEKIFHGNPCFSVMNTSCSSFIITVFGSCFPVRGFLMYMVNPFWSMSVCSVNTWILQYPVIFPHVTLVCPLSPDRTRFCR